MEKYEAVRDIGSGNFGVARLMRNRETRELVAVKCIERGHRIDENVYREIINHRSLRHPNIIRFKEVILTPTHLMIVMEFAAGGELFDRICDRGRFSEDEARYFFQQLICGVSYCHYMQICHRDLKLENVLLDGSPAPRLKICDFGYSKSSVLHSRPKSAVGTPAYIAPEVLSRREYDGKAAVQCILPKEWEGIYFGGLGKAVMYLDLDCRFDALRMAQILRNRIAEGRSSAHTRNGEFEKDGTKDKFHCSFQNTLFSDCMQRFLYTCCYSSPEFVAALKTVQSQLRSDVLGVSMYFLMIDSIGAFYWIDRGSQPVRENKGKSLQSITETVVKELRKVLQLQPALVLVTKSPIYGEGTTAANDFNKGSSKYMLADSTVLGYSRQEEERNISCREYMPSIWQSFVTHRIKLQVEEAEVSSMQENDVLSMHTSEWVQPSLKTKEKFSIRDGGVVLIQ